MTRIVHNGPGGGHPAGTIDDLLAVLRVATLDPRFEDCGNFRNDAPEGAPPGTIVFWGNFLDVSHLFRIETDEADLAERLGAAIEANKATPTYQRVRAELAEEAAARVRRFEAEREARRVSDIRTRTP